MLRQAFILKACLNFELILLRNDLKWGEIRVYRQNKSSKL